jgi:hypothetical protein
MVVKMVVEGLCGPSCSTSTTPPAFGQLNDLAWDVRDVPLYTALSRHWRCHFRLMLSHFWKSSNVPRLNWPHCAPPAHGLTAGMVAACCPKTAPKWPQIAPQLVGGSVTIDCVRSLRAGENSGRDSCEKPSKDDLHATPQFVNENEESCIAHLNSAEATPKTAQRRRRPRNVRPFSERQVSKCQYGKKPGALDRIS